jgi:hypothetical protein
MTGDERDDPDDDLADSDTSDEYPIPPPDPDAVIDGERGGEGQDTAGVPDSDPRHIDPAGDLADAVESGELGIELSDDQDVDDLREFLDAVDAGEFDPVDPGLEATVRIVRELLDENAVDDE